MRKTITSIIAIILVVGGYFYAQQLANKEKRQRPAPKKSISTVFYDKVMNGDVAFQLKKVVGFQQKTSLRFTLRSQA